MLREWMFILFYFLSDRSGISQMSPGSWMSYTGTIDKYSTKYRGIEKSFGGQTSMVFFSEHRPRAAFTRSNIPHTMHTYKSIDVN